MRNVEQVGKYLNQTILSTKTGVSWRQKDNKNSTFMKSQLPLSVRV
jgi:hypothetical protein